MMTIRRGESHSISGKGSIIVVSSTWNEAWSKSCIHKKERQREHHKAFLSFGHKWKTGGGVSLSYMPCRCKGEWQLNVKAKEEIGW